MSSKNVNDADTRLVDFNEDRKGVVIRNVSDTDIYIEIDGEASVAEGMPLKAAGGVYSATGEVAQASINAIHADAGNLKNVRIMEAF